MRTMYDAAFPPPVPPATDAVAFYILPRDGDPAHTWFPTPAQDRAFRLPITVNSFGGDGARVANDCKAWAQLNGMPPGTCFALDLETLVDGVFVSTFNATLWPWLCLKYGSTGNIFRDPPTSGGAWVATLNGIERMYPGADATQWIDTGAVDLSLVGDEVRLWQPGATPPPPPSKPRRKPMFVFQLVTNDARNGSLYSSDLNVYRWLNGGQVDVAKFLIARSGLDPTPVKVSDPHDMGVPTDATTASAAGVAWPGQAG